MTRLRVLIVENSSANLSEQLHALRAGGFEVTFKQIETCADLRDAVNSDFWQVIIVHDEVKTFDLNEALEIVTPLNISFFIVGDSPSNEFTLKMIRAGAQDYLPKDGTERLVSLIHREVKDFTRRQGSQLALQIKGEQLRQMQKMEAVGRLAGGIAHDYNNLLAAILMISELAMLKIDDDHPASSDIKQIQETVTRAASLTNDLLVFSRKQATHKVTLDLNSAVNQMQKMFQSILGEQIDLRMELKDDLGGIQTDLGQLEQTLLNLVLNARDAMPSGGTLKIHTENVRFTSPQVSPFADIPPGSYVSLKIEDSGCGMVGSTIERIFEPFFTTKGVKGTGLGLSTVLGLLQQAKAYITVHSDIGKGSRFVIYYPACDEAPLSNDEFHAPAPESTNATVLLVEDQGQLRKAVGDALRRKNYTVLEARDPAEAMAVCANHKGTLELMITDMNMPGMNGIQLIKKLKPLKPEMRVMLMSGYLEDKSLDPDLDLQTEKIEFLQKPFSIKFLIEKIRETLGEPKTPAKSA